MDEAYEDGRWLARWHQQGIAEGTMNPDLSLWEMWNREKCVEREEYLRRAAQGDAQAAWEAEFLDGYLVVWDV